MHWKNQAYRGKWTRGNDLGAAVIAQAYRQQETLIFPFGLDDIKRSQSLTSRIVNCYHDLAVDRTGTTFLSRLSTRMAI